MAQQDIDLIRGGYDAFARQDMAAVRERFRSDIEWSVPESLPEGGTYRGPDAVLGFFSRLPELYPELRVEPDQYLDAGDHVVVLGHHRGRGHNGTPFEARFVHVWQMRDGKAAAFSETADTAAILPALQPGQAATS